MEPSDQSIDSLNALLRGELCAVKSYRHAYERVPHPRFRACLDDCMQSHARRVQLLRRRIQAWGGIPATRSGTWGIFAMSIALVAGLFGPGAILATLELGEAHGQLAYTRKLPKLDPQSRAFVAAQLVPAQILTREWIVELKRGARVMLASFDR